MPVGSTVDMIAGLPDVAYVFCQPDASNAEQQAAGCYNHTASSSQPLLATTLSVWTQDARHNSTLSASVDIAIGSYILSLGVCILFSNVLILLTCMLVKRAVSNLELCIANTALAGATVAAIGLPMAAISSFNHGWIFSRPGCVRDGFLVFFLSMVINGTLTLMSVLRYIKVCRPLFDRHITRRRVLLLLCCTYIYAGIWAIPPLFGTGRYGLEPFNLVCSLDWKSLPLSYVVPLFLFGYILPIGCMGWCYAAMVFSVRKARRLVRRGTSKKDLYLTKIVVMMCSGYIAAWTPYAVVTFMAQFNSVMLETRYLAAPSLFAKTSLAYNPIIYYFMVKRFRDEVRQLVCGCSIKTSAGSAIMEEEVVERQPRGLIDQSNKFFAENTKNTVTSTVVVNKYIALKTRDSMVLT